MKQSVPFGYRSDGNNIQIDEIDSTVVKWTFDTLKRYTEHPPKILVQDVIDTAIEEKGKIITYTDAEQLVSYSAIQSYLNYEVGLKYKYYHSLSDKSLEDMKEILATPLEEIQQKFTPDIKEDISCHSVLYVVRRNQVQEAVWCMKSA